MPFLKTELPINRRYSLDKYHEKKIAKMTKGTIANFSNSITDINKAAMSKSKCINEL